MTATKTSPGLLFYKGVTHLLAPAVPYVLSRRQARGKEDGARLSERKGIASLPRPSGPLIWFHAASVGESLSILPLINSLVETRPALHILVTTGTVTSAQLMAERLPARAFHQFVPLDHPKYCAAFLDHWQPDLAVWVESEFWPNLITTADARHIPLALINARITLRSARNWQYAPSFISNLLSRFSLLMAQDKASASRLHALGATEVAEPGNLKHVAEPLHADPATLTALQSAIGSRPRWLASNTHDNEEEIAAQAHLALAQHHSQLLTIIVPRHPARGDSITTTLKAMGLRVARHSQRDSITAETDIYLGDTLGEMGLFYSLADIAFIGGTIAPSGGHNPFEAALLDCALITGPSDFNFAESYAAFQASGAMHRITDAESLTRTVNHLLMDEVAQKASAHAAREVARRGSGATRRTLDALLTLLDRSKEGTHHA